MQVTKGTWRMREQCVPGSLSSFPTQEPGNKAIQRPGSPMCFGYCVSVNKNRIQCTLQLLDSQFENPEKQFFLLCNQNPIRILEDILALLFDILTRGMQVVWDNLPIVIYTVSVVEKEFEICHPRLHL